MKNISAVDLRKLRETKDIVVINVLPPESFRGERVPGSINIPAQDNDNFERQVEAVGGGKDRGVVVYCASEECDASPKAAERLEQAGFTEIYDFTGGTREWGEEYELAPTRKAQAA